MAKIMRRIKWECIAFLGGKGNLFRQTRSTKRSERQKNTYTNNIVWKRSGALIVNEVCCGCYARLSDPLPLTPSSPFPPPPFPLHRTQSGYSTYYIPPPPNPFLHHTAFRNLPFNPFTLSHLVSSKFLAPIHNLTTALTPPPPPPVTLIINLYIDSLLQNSTFEFIAFLQIQCMASLQKVTSCIEKRVEAVVPKESLPMILRLEMIMSHVL